MEIALTATLFFLLLIVFELIYSLFKKPESRQITRAVEKYSNDLTGEEEVDIFYYRRFSDIKIIDTLLMKIPVVGRLDEMMQQGGVKMLASVFILMTFVAGGVVFMACSYKTVATPITIVLSLAGALMPFFYLLFKRKQRRSQFEALFPDALDLMSYSLKAGHSILASFKMASEEISDPIGEEFSRIVEEINFGQDLNSVLRNFSQRIDSVELRFFVTSVIIQRETGGNLVEMLVKISQVIRRKFRFREKVNTLSAEGKLSAIILLALPFLCGIALFVVNPEYLEVLFTDPVGPYIIAIALVMMSFGTFIMYRFVQLDL